jgi:hypothetical protein
MVPEHKPVRRGREMIDLLAVEEPKPKPAKIRDRPFVQTHVVVSFASNGRSWSAASVMAAGCHQYHA